MIKIFGCSFSADDTPYTHWSTILRNMTGHDCVNYARSGQTNEHIMFSIIENLREVESDDIIIINTSGQGRMSVGPKSKYVWYPNRKDYLNIYTQQINHSGDWDLVRKWNETYYFPNIIDKDPFIDSIIHLANELQTKVSKVILWNLSSLNRYTSTQHNDGIQDSAPKIPHTDLWTPTSLGGTMGYAHYFHDNNLAISSKDPHPNQEGHVYLAQEFLNELGYDDDLKSQSLI